jgi:hypothetical protein
MSYLALSIGIVATLLGLAIIVLTIVFLRKNRVKNIFIGIVFAILGASIIWLGFQGNSTFQINIGISEKQFGLVLIGFVMSLFILKGVLDIREGSKNLQDKTISSFLVFKSKFQIIVAVIVTTWVVFLLAVAFTQLGR